MGKKVNVVLRNGRVVSVDEEVARGMSPGSGGIEGDEGPSERARQAYNEENTSGVAAALVSGANTVLGGIPGLLGLSERNKEAVEQHPLPALAGDVAAIAAPTGLLGKTAKTLTSGTVIGQAARLGQLGTAGRIGEGIILGAAGHIAHATVSGDPITVEGLAADIGLSTLLNVGIGAAADRFTNMLKKAKGSTSIDDLLPGAKPHVKGDAPLAKVARAKMAAEEAELAAREAKDEATKSVLRQRAEENVAAAKATMDESPVYANFRDTYNSAQDAVVAANKTVTSEANKFAEFASQAGGKKTLATYEKAANKLRSELKKVQDEVDAAVKADVKAAGTKKPVTFAQGAKVKPTEPVPLDIDTNRIDQLNKALSEITKLKDATKAAMKSDDFEMLHTYMNGAHQRVEEALSAATKPGFESSISVKLPEIPKYPGQISPVAAKLPTNLTDIGRMHTDTIASIANAMDDVAAAETINLARSLGLEAETAGDALVGIHQLTKEAFHTPIPSGAISKEAKAAERLAEKADNLKNKAKWDDAAAEVDRAREVTGGRLEWGFSDGNLKVGVRSPGHKGSLLGAAKDWTRSGVISAAGRAADIGGWKGAMLRRLAYGAAGYGIDGVDGAFLGVAAGSARAGLLGGIRETVANAAAKLGPGLNTVRPLTAYLGSRGGRSADKSLFDGEGAKQLMDEVYSAVQTAPDATYELMKGFMGQAGDLAFQLHAKVMNGLQYLADTAPKDPGVDVTASGSNWEPNAYQINDWLHRYEATLEPLNYVKRIFAGDGHPAGVEALAWNWPAILAETQTEAAMKNWQDMTETQNSALSILFQRPITAAQNPDVIATIQGMYLQSMNQPQPKSDSRNTGGPVGRPAAVQSPVAGSNVSQLIA